MSNIIQTKTAAERFAALVKAVMDCKQYTTPPATDVLCIFWDRVTGSMQGCGDFQGNEDASEIAKILREYADMLDANGDTGIGDAMQIANNNAPRITQDIE